MPNWAEGSLKIRGPIKNIKRFLDEGIIDIAIHTFEKGAEFEQDILIKDGEIVKDEIIEYDNYRFESAMPMLGG